MINPFRVGGVLICGILHFSVKPTNKHGIGALVLSVVGDSGYSADYLQARQLLGVQLLVWVVR